MKKNILILCLFALCALFLILENEKLLVMQEQNKLLERISDRLGDISWMEDEDDEDDDDKQLTMFTVSPHFDDKRKTIESINQ